MLRGGAFNNNQQNVRAAYRNNNPPDNRNNNIGFRVVSTAFCAADNGCRAPAFRAGYGLRGEAEGRCRRFPSAPENPFRPGIYPHGRRPVRHPQWGRTGAGH